MDRSRQAAAAEQRQGGQPGRRRPSVQELSKKIVDNADFSSQYYT
jgi:hypothetical protein